MTEWRDVVGYEGHYRVSDAGEVWVVRERTARGQRRPVKALKPGADQYGYPQVNLTRDGRSRTRRVHLIVMEAFIGPCPEGLEARHLDSDSSNPALSNLKYGTHAENCHDQLEHGTHPQAAKAKCSRGHELVPPNLTIHRLLEGCRACRSCAWARSDAAYAIKSGRVVGLQERSDEHYRRLTSSSHYLKEWIVRARSAQVSGRWADRADAAWCRALRDALLVNDRAAMALLRETFPGAELIDGGAV